MRLLILALTVLTTCATGFAQNAVDGKWRIKTDDRIDGVLSNSEYSLCILHLSTDKNGLITGDYKECNRATTVEAQLFNNEIVTCLIQDADGIIVCTGRWDGENVIKGTFYQQGVGKEGDFVFQRLEPQAVAVARKRVAEIGAKRATNEGEKPARTATPVTDVNTYIVKQGETFYGIARKYNLTLQQLLDLNNKTEPSIKVGDIIRIAP